MSIYIFYITLHYITLLHYKHIQRDTNSGWLPFGKNCGSLAKRDLKWSVWHCRIYCDLHCQRWQLVKNYFVTKTDRYNKYQTKQYTHTLTHCAHNSWWPVLGWVTTKEDHPLLWFDGSTIEIWSVNKYITITITCLWLEMRRIPEPSLYI